MAGRVPGLTANRCGARPPDGDAARTDIVTGTTETPVSITTDGPTTLLVQSLVLQPGASSGWHTHPGTELSVVTDVVRELAPNILAGVRFLWCDVTGRRDAITVPASPRLVPLR